MSPEPSYAENVLAKQAMSKYADSIVRWGGVFRTICTVVGWIYLVGGPLIGFIMVAGQQASAINLLGGILIGAIAALVMFGYRLIFDYMLMKAHQSRIDR
jgi:hypothetical protein